MIKGKIIDLRAEIYAGAPTMPIKEIIKFFHDKGEKIKQSGGDVGSAYAYLPCEKDLKFIAEAYQ